MIDNKSLFINYSLENFKTQNSTGTSPGISASQCHSDESRLFKKSEEYKHYFSYWQEGTFPQQWTVNISGS